MSNASNPYGMSEGSTVEEQSVYNPEKLLANGADINISLGSPEQVWTDYALEILPIKLDGSDTGRRLIMRNGEMLGAVSDQYRLIPNEEVVSAADEIAADLGAVPFDDFTGDWFVKLQNNVFMDEEGRRAHALYAWNDPVPVGGDDEVQVGFGVHNSIDGSMGLRVGLFTFRHACANMVFMGLGQGGMDFDQRNVLSHSAKKHTKNLEIEQLRAWIEETVGYAPSVIDAYKRWTSDELSRSDAVALLQMARAGRLSRRNDVPEWIQNAVEYTEDLDEQVREGQEDLDGQQFVNGLPQDKVADIAEAFRPQGELMWDTYNDLTANLWHAESTNDQSKMQKMRQVHKVFDPSPQGDDEVQIR